MVRLEFTADGKTLRISPEKLDNPTWLVCTLIDSDGAETVLGTEDDGVLVPRLLDGLRSPSADCAHVRRDPEGDFHTLAILNEIHYIITKADIADGGTILEFIGGAPSSTVRMVLTPKERKLLEETLIRSCRDIEPR